MAYDQKLADRIRALVAGRPGVSEKAMFGGLAFLLDGRMFCGVNKDDLMVRAGPARHDEALAKPHARSMDFTGRPMKGYVFVGAEGCRTSKMLAPWVEWSSAVVRSPSCSGRPTGARRARLRISSCRLRRRMTPRHTR